MPTPQPVEGGPIWIDLSSHDVEAASTFYRELFGWQIEDSGPDYGHYRMIMLGDRPIGGMMSSLMSADGPTDEPQTPTVWTTYLQTGDIAAATEATRSAGGQVIVEPMPVGPLGQMGVVSDPAGAVVGFWQPADFSGMAAVAEVGAPCWFEQLSVDFDAALPYYRDVLGWDVQWMGDDEPAAGQPRYVTHGAGDAAVAGICEANAWLPEGTPSFWRVYFGVSDTDAALAKLTELGGTVLDGPMDSPFGLLATVADPQGAMFQIITAD